MSPRPFAPHRIRRLSAGRVVAATLAAVLAAGCTSGTALSSPTASPEASAAGTVAPTPAPATVPPATPSLSPVESPSAVAPTPDTALPALPPEAVLADASDALVRGALGSYTWGDGGDDAPWIIVRASVAATGAGPWTLSFAPDVPVDSWTAAWAPIRSGRPGPVSGYEQGTTGPVSFIGPTGMEPWTLKVEVTFARGGSAVYYWRLEPAG